jgi:hypothetical protein
MHLSHKDERLKGLKEAWDKMNWGEHWTARLRSDELQAAS